MRSLIIPLQPDRYSEAEALILAAAPERIESVRDWPRMPDAPPGDGDSRRDFVAVDADDPVAVIGYGSLRPQGEGRFRMDLVVARDRRRRGVGGALQEALGSQNTTIVQARALESRPDALDFLMRRGFTRTNRMIHQRLSLASTSTAAMPTLTLRLEAERIAVTTLEREQVRTADWLVKFLDLLCATGPERVGNPYGVGAETGYWSAETAARVWESSEPLSPDAVFPAKSNEQYVGLSFLSQGGTSERIVAQGETGVHVDWRRRGVATLLKLHAIDYARQHGYEEITTRTASPGMSALNERLGFRQDGAEIRLVRRIANA